MFKQNKHIEIQHEDRIGTMSHAKRNLALGAVAFGLVAGAALTPRISHDLNELRHQHSLDQHSHNPLDWAARPLAESIHRVETGIADYGQPDDPKLFGDEEMIIVAPETIALVDKH